MEYDTYIAPDGATYEFDDQVDRFMLSITGQGIPPVEHITQRGPFQHGETWLDYRLRPRTIRLIHQRVAGPTRTDFWSVRADMLNKIRLNRHATAPGGVLRKTLEDGSLRDIDVIINSGLTLDQGEHPSKGCYHVRDMIEFVAHDPTFYDPTDLTTSWVSPVFTDLVFPITFPITFGGGGIDEAKDITYTGTWPAYPTIVITGPFSGPVITNQTTNEWLALEYEVDPGEIITIVTAFGRKSVTNNVGTNLIGALTTDSDLSTFHLEPAPAASGGVNSIKVQGVSPDSNVTVVELTYNTRYIGI